MTGILHTRDGAKALIGMIHQEDTLWNIHSDDYTKREMRDTSMIRVAESLGVSVKAVKSRWHSIRTCYTKELKKIKASENSGAEGRDVYRPKWFYFDMVDVFLRSTIFPRRVVVELCDDSLSQSSPNEGDNIDNDNDEQAGNIRNIDSHVSPSAMYVKKRKASTPLYRIQNQLGGDSIDSGISIASHKDILKADTVKPIEDDADIFGKLVANGLRRITNQRAQGYAKLQIQNILFEAEFGEHPQTKAH